jgi:ubiquinone/menaquinone biosynthesis C-methylase UbiE
MKLRELQRNWDEWARTDPLYAVLAHPEKKGAKWDPEDFLATGRQEVAAIMPTIEELGLEGRTRALDFGCGAGRLTQALAEKFERVVGVDISPTVLEVAKQLNRRGAACQFMLNQRDDLSLFRDREFDFVYSFIVLQHMTPKYAVGYLSEFFRVSVPGSLVVFQMPEPFRWQGIKAVVPDWILAGYRRVIGRSGPVMQMYGMTRDNVVALVTRSGGSIVKVEPRGSVDMPGHLYFCRNVRGSAAI